MHCVVKQAGRRLAGYANWEVGGIAPQFLRCIPFLERNSFQQFATILMDGPFMDGNLRIVFALVILLRHEEVKKTYPDHPLIKETERAIMQAGFSEHKLAEWTSNICKHWKEINSSALSIEQVQYVVY